MNEIVRFHEQAQIVDTINRLMVGQDVAIFRDKSHYKSWICLQYRHISKEQKILFFQSTMNFKWNKFNEFKTEFAEMINGWLPPIVYNAKNPAELFEVSTRYTPSDSSDQFLLTLVFAIGCILKFPKCYGKPFGEPENKEKIRHAIAKALMEKRMPTIEEMWGEH